MNNDNKIVDQNPSVGNQVQASTPLGVANKEIGPIPSVIPEIIPAGPEVKHGISQELQELGVEEKKDAPDLTSGHKQIGVEHSGATVPIPSGPIGLVQIPEVTDINSSGTWLNTLMGRIQKVMELMGV